MFTTKDAEYILKGLRKRKLNAFLIGSIAIQGRGNDIDIILIDVPENWKDLVADSLPVLHTFTPNDWDGGLFVAGDYKVDIFIKNAKEEGLPPTDESVGIRPTIL